MKQRDSPPTVIVVEFESNEQRSTERYRRAFLTSSSAIAAKVLSVSVSLVTVPLTLNYLGRERYGMWMTISSFVGMLAFVDFGISLGLINRIADANGRNDPRAMRRDISNSFCVAILFASLLLLALALIHSHISWPAVFNVHSANARSEAGPAIKALALCFILGLPLGLVASIQSGLQSGFITNCWNGLANLVSLISVLIAIHFRVGLVPLVLCVSGTPLIAALFNAAYMGLRFPHLLPRLRDFSRRVALSLLTTGLNFSVLQIAGTIAYLSDNLVIAHYLGAAAVSGYAVPGRLFNVVNVLIGVISVPSWPAYADALARGDGAWIRRTFIRLALSIIGMTTIVSLVLVALCNRILALWVGSQITASLGLLLLFGLRCTISAYLQPVSFLLNGLGLVRVQSAIAVVMSIVNLSLSIYFVKYFGISGVLMGTVVSEILIVVGPQTLIVARSLRKL
jgi:O-antigen/teichoic acid export membrane protein